MMVPYEQMMAKFLQATRRSTCPIPINNTANALESSVTAKTVLCMLPLTFTAAEGSSLSLRPVHKLEADTCRSRILLY